MHLATIVLSGLLALASSLALSAEERTGAERLTNIEDVTRGSTVVLRGEVTRILDEDEFRLEDGTGSIRIYIGWKNRVDVDVGETVTVRGFVDDDLVNYFRPEVYARELIRQDGTVVQLK